MIAHREGSRVFAKKVDILNVKPLRGALMNWEVLTNMKGPVLANEMRNGILTRLWGGYTGVVDFATPRDVVDAVACWSCGVEL